MQRAQTEETHEQQMRDELHIVVGDGWMDAGCIVYEVFGVSIKTFRA